MNNMELLKLLLFMAGTFSTQMLAGTLAAATNNPRAVDVSTRSEALEKTILLGKSQNEVTDRDMHEDWDEFRNETAKFDAKFEDWICISPHLLKEIHDKMTELSKKVKLAWELKQQQLKDLTAILVHENYTETGLARGIDKVADACNGLNDYITKANETAFVEKLELDKHLKEVEDEKVRLDTHPCPCIWAAWSEWDSCSKTCGGGTKKRTRIIEKEAKNNGTHCLGASNDSESCHLKHCPIDCKWGSWEKWGRCPGCNGDTEVQKKLRTRDIEVQAQHGGNKCDGPHFQEEECTLVNDLEKEMSALEKEKVALEEGNKELKNLNGQLKKELEGICDTESTNTSGLPETTLPEFSQFNQKRGFCLEPMPGPGDGPSFYDQEYLIKSLEDSDNFYTAPACHQACKNEPGCKSFAFAAFMFGVRMVPTCTLYRKEATSGEGTHGVICYTMA